MIVRILGDGQYELDEKTVEQLNALDADFDKAVQEGDQARFDQLLASIISEVHSHGQRLSDTIITPSDLTLPDAEATLDEVRALLSDDTSQD